MLYQMVILEQIFSEIDTQKMKPKVSGYSAFILDVQNANSETSRLLFGHLLTEQQNYNYGRSCCYGELWKENIRI